MNPLRKNILREIRGTWKRFLSIALMAFLGAGFFAGIHAASRDMQISCDAYLDEQNCFDLEVLSTLGLTQDDVDAVLAVEGISAAAGVYSENVRVDIGDQDEKVKLLSIPEDSDINALVLCEGEMAQKENECVVPRSLLDFTGKNIGDILTITETREDGEKSSFVCTELTITGVIESPLYVYSDSGTNERSTGAVADYLFVPQCTIAEDYFTELYLTVNGALELQSFDSAYDALIDRAQLRVKAIAEERQQARYDQIAGDAQTEISDAQDELDDKTAQAQQEIANAQDKLTQAQEDLDSGWRELTQSRLEAQRKFAEAQEKIDAAEKQLEQAKQSYRVQAAAAKQTRAQLEKQRTQLQEQLSGLQQQRAETAQMLESLQQQRAETAQTLEGLQNQRTQLAAALIQVQAALDACSVQLEAAEQTRAQQEAAGEDTTQIDEQIVELRTSQKEWEEAYSGYELQLNQLDSGIAQTQEGLTQLDDGIAQAQDGLAQLDSGIAQIQDGLAQIDSAVKKIDSGLQSGQEQISSAEKQIVSAKQSLARSKTTVASQLEEARQELIAGQTEIDDGKTELAVQQADFDGQIADAQAELDKARDEVGDINLPTWYVLTREGNSGLSSFSQDSENLKRVGVTFPLIFFLVAVLISLSSMTRMVEEQRSLIGTLKALGYSRAQIERKYLVYAASASVSGAIVGELVGFQTLPRIVWGIYEVFYTLPAFYTPIDPVYGAVGLTACAGCIVAATGVACWGELRHTPAQLMRPKAPNPGKRVLLERVTPLWRRLNFSQKVTLRNLFRYKKRFLMTICGIAGCAALVTTGFGLRDSLRLLLPLQYDTVMHYDLIAVTDSNLTRGEFSTLTDELGQNRSVESCLSICAESIKIVAADGGTKELELFVPSDAQALEQYISLRSTQDEEQVTLSGDSVVLTEQIAGQLDLSVGDTVSLRREDGTKADVTVGAIVHNYLSHYAFLSKEGYEAAYGEVAEDNAFIINAVEMDDAQSDAFAAEFNRDDRFTAVSSTRAARAATDSRLSMLNQVVVVLIAAAAALAVVVLYNLSTINISERIRELATIKVLGFYDMEVYRYNTRETVLLTLIGTVLGLACGRWLTAFILLTMEMQGIVVVPVVEPLSYVLAAVLTILFASAVNFMTYFSLRKIDMVEALKSVE